MTYETSLSYLLHVIVISVSVSDLLLSACLMKWVTFLNRLGLDPEQTGQRHLYRSVYIQQQWSGMHILNSEFSCINMCQNDSASV